MKGGFVPVLATDLSTHAPKEHSIMAFPLIPAAAGVLATVIGYKWWEKRKKASEIGPGPASTLLKGATYAIQATLNRTQADAAIMVKDQASAALYLYNWFTVCGFKVLGTATQSRPGDDSSWVLVGQWTKDDKYVTAPANPAVPSAAFYRQPIAITAV